MVIGPNVKSYIFFFFFYEIVSFNISYMLLYYDNVVYKVKNWKTMGEDKINYLQGLTLIFLEV